MTKKPYYSVEQVTEKFNLLYAETSTKQIERYNALFEDFKMKFKADNAYFCSSSGRVEICGNHTDHNGGQVIACAISLDSVATFLPSNDNVITIYSDGYGKLIVDLDSETQEKVGSSQAIIKGVAEGLKNFGYNVGGFNACVTSNVLGGAGISSSASFELLIAEIFNFLYNNGKVNEEEKAKIAQYSENVFFGKPCGLLDQTAISFGGLNVLDFSDKQKIAVTSINNNLSDYTLVLINTGGSHENLTDEYASIPSEMFSVAKYFGKERLIEIDKQVFVSNISKIKKVTSDRAILRAEHFYEENDRVNTAYNALQKNDYNLFLKQINESGESSLNKLQNCYVFGSTERPIVDALEISKPFLNGGANRVHGGGFAGTILNIVKNDCVTEFIKEMEKHFDSKDIIPLKVRSVGTIVL